MKGNIEMDKSGKKYSILFILIGTCGLLFSRHYSGPMEEFFHCYGANITFSFGAYYIIKLFRFPLADNIYINALYTLTGLSIQETAQHYGLYPGTFDPQDLVFNTAGVVLAVIMEVVMLEGENSSK